MKTIYQYGLILLFILLNLVFTKADSKDSVIQVISQDSTEYGFEVIDSTCLNIDSFTVESKNLNRNTQKIPNAISNKSKKNSLKEQKQYDFWSDLWNVVTDVFDFVTAPVRPVWGEYAEYGQNTTAPMALFRRSTFEKDKAAIISSILVDRSDIQRIYEDIYTQVLLSPEGWGTSGSQAPNAAYAKFGAFVLLMGVDNTGAPLSSTDSTTIATNVLSILNTCFYYTPKSWFEGGDWWKILKFNTDWIDWDDVHQYRSKDLIHYCCAYELMRTAGYQNLEPHRKQIKKYATELYWQATDNFSSMSNIINNNLVLMTASSLAMAAMVCNMETDYLWYPWRHPSRWVNKSFARINQTMFTSWTHTESKRGGVYGYREGPWYYAYSMENLMPMFVMFNNYVSENQNFSSLYFENHLFTLSNLQTLWLSYFLTVEHVKNFMHDPDWKNTWEWYADLMQANGTAVPYDDSKVNTAIPMLACTKMPNYSLIDGDNLRKLLGNDKPDFLAANNPSSSKVKKVNLYRNRANHQSGNIMLRTEMFDGDTSYHYLHALAEPNPGVLETIRLNLGSSYVHEHADALSFTISAGNELLAIDPPYMGYERKDSVNKGIHHNLITIDGYGPGLTDFPVIKKYNEQTKSVHLRNEFRSAATEREIKVYYEEGSSAPYYEIIDVCAGISSHLYKFNLNGNGDKNTGSCDDSKLQTDGSVVWKYPCTNNREWGLYAKVTSFSNTGTGAVYSLTNDLKHGNTGVNIGTGNILSNDVLHNIDDFNYSYHSRMGVEQTGQIVLFHTIIKPMTCDEIADMGSPAEQGKVSSSVDTSRTVTVVDSIGSEYRKNIHVARTNNSYQLTINNPKLASGSGPFPDMVLQAEHGFYHFHRIVF